MGKGTIIRVRRGYGNFFLSEHCRERMFQRKIGFKDLKTAIRNGDIVYEREGVNKVIHWLAHIIFDASTLRIFTVYRPYIYDEQGNIIGNFD